MGAALTVALALGWAAVVVRAAWSFRPPPLRVRALVAEPPTPGSAPPTPTGGGTAAGPADTRVEDVSGRRPGPVERLGAWLLRRLGASGTAAPSPTTARRLGLAVVAALVCLPVVPIAAAPAALLAWATPAVAMRRRERVRLAALGRDLPDVVDLLVLGVSSGLTVHLAVARVAARGSGPLAEELARVVDEVSLGRRLADALDDLPGRVGEDVRPLVAALVASERYGAPLVAGLERLADEVRRDRRRRAEEAARKVPVKLLFPLVTCTLPAFGLLTVAPLVASAVRSLHL
jgi:tight adherence protein C